MQLTSPATAYNNNNCLLLAKLPNDQLIEIFSHCLSDDKDQVKSLKNSIKNLMQASLTCKHFNKLLSFKAIGNLCKQYTQASKNQVLRDVVKNIDAMRTSISYSWVLLDPYSHNRLTALILVYAGADVNVKDNDDRYYSDALLKYVVEYNDTYLIKKLFKHYADPNLKKLLFSVKTKKMAQLLIDKGADIHATNSSGLNILWHIFDDIYPLDLMEFYLRRGVNPKQLDPKNNSCLLHNSCNLSLAKITLLLDKAPELINTLNKKGQTPLDVLQPNEDRDKTFSDMLFNITHSLSDNNNVPLKQRTQNELEKLEFEDFAFLFKPKEYCQERIALLRNHGAYTAQELQEISLMRNYCKNYKKS